MSATQEILPGDTLKQITEENRHIDEFVEWMKRRLELDKKYTEDLKALRMSANLQWFQSGVSPLVSPMLELITREVEERQATYDTMNTYLKEFSHVNSPDHHEETGESMIRKYDDLIAACKEHDRCREEASSTKAVKELKQWHEAGPNGGKEARWNTDFSLFVLPEIERDYRESIVRQQALVRVVNTWHQSHLPELLDSHQSRSEDLKALVVRMITEHSHFLTALVGHLEATKDNVHEFSSSSFISWAHEQCDSESGHGYMKEAVHIDFSNGTMRSHVIFGTVSQTPLELERAMKAFDERNRLHWLYTAIPTKDKALELEQSLATPTSSQLPLLSSEKLGLLCYFGFLSNPPLIPLNEEEIKRYANGISRKNIHIIMSKVTRHGEIEALLKNRDRYTLSYRTSSARLMTHRDDCERIVEDIYLKWDFSNNRPFPPGVKRE